MRPVPMGVSRPVKNAAVLQSGARSIVRHPIINECDVCGCGGVSERCPQLFFSAEKSIIHGDGGRGFDAGHGAGHDTGVVSSGHDQFGRGPGLQIHALLVACDRGGGLDRHAEDEGHADTWRPHSEKIPSEMSAS